MKSNISQKTPRSKNPKKKYKFSGHQTFVFRYGWLEKGVRGVVEYGNIFSREDALVLLGVGKNMVSSIRHWCEVTQLIEFENFKGSGRQPHVSEIGQRLLLPGGWDPFLEDDASLWLIHWLLVSNPIIGTSFQLLFSKYYRTNFTRKELLDFVASFIEKNSIKVSEHILRRDIDCLIRVYANIHKYKNQIYPEETFECPLLQLDLIQLSPDGDTYKFAIGPKRSLPTGIFAFALFQYFQNVAGETNTISVQKCLYGEGSPGQAFKLDENSLIEYIEDLEDKTNGAMIIDETAGIKQIYRRHPIQPIDILDDYYRNKS